MSAYLIGADAIAVPGLVMVLLAYVRYLRLAHSPAGSLKAIEAGIALRKSLRAGKGGRPFLAALLAALVSLAIAGIIDSTSIMSVAATLMATAGCAIVVNGFSLSVMTASISRVMHAIERGTQDDALRRASNAAWTCCLMAAGVATLVVAGWAGWMPPVGRAFAGTRDFIAVFAYAMIYSVVGVFVLPGKPDSVAEKALSAARLAVSIAAIAVLLAAIAMGLSMTIGSYLIFLIVILPAGTCLTLAIVFHRILRKHILDLAIPDASGVVP